MPTEERQLVEDYAERLARKLRTGDATEHTHRSALERFIEDLTGATATNEPRRSECGAPDYEVSRGDGAARLKVGHVEAKDVGTPLETQQVTEQLRRYREALPNLILTDYVTFRWYLHGELEGDPASIGDVDADGNVILDDDGVDAVLSMLWRFVDQEPQEITSAELLAKRLARLARLLRPVVAAAIEADECTDDTTDMLTAFREVLLPGLSVEAFADYYAQTTAYGLFAARVGDDSGDTFTRRGAVYHLPRSNEFLRRLFDSIASVTLEDEPFVGIVDDIAGMLDHIDPDEILSEFGTEQWRRDPVVHFYETFLSHYDPEERAQRGVFYTPPPVVDFIVRGVDQLLQDDFRIARGLTDSKQIDGQHRVQLLDPATGTGTFLYSVVAHVRRQFLPDPSDGTGGNAGQWDGYASQHLRDRLHGFELLMAPYVIAHLKLSLQLAGADLPATQRDQFGVQGDDERWNVYLTNALRESEVASAVPFGQFLADEANAAGSVKMDLPILVVLGNPPYYGHSANAAREKREVQRGARYHKVADDGGWEESIARSSRRITQPTFIGRILDDYYYLDGSRLRERNPKWLQDDYVKFIRFGQWRVSQTGQGVLAYITNHSFLDNPTFRGMRQQLLREFDDLYIVDLHGNQRRRETAPDGSADENVFDVKQGVCVFFFVKRPDGDGSNGTVHHIDKYGDRTAKYSWLDATDLGEISWTDFEPTEPLYLFRPVDEQRATAYAEAVPTRGDVFEKGTTGFVTGRDGLTVAFTKSGAVGVLEDLAEDGARKPDSSIRRTYLTADDGLDLPAARDALRELEDDDRDALVRPCLYRPFDDRYALYTNVLMERPRELLPVMQGIENLALVTGRSNKSGFPDHFFATRNVAEAKSAESTTQSYVLPLYVKEEGQMQMDVGGWAADDEGRRPNLAPDFVHAIAEATAMEFTGVGSGDLDTTFAAEDVAAFVYGQWYSPTYRNGYALQICVNHPRVFLPPGKAQFVDVARLGHELLSVHLGEADLDVSGITYPVPGTHEVGTAFPDFALEADVTGGESDPDDAHDSAGTEDGSLGRVLINSGDDNPQYFGGVPEEVYNFTVGGYQPCRRWLRERRGRTLSYDDQEHYKYLVAAAAKTMELMEDLESVTDWLRPETINPATDGPTPEAASDSGG